MRVYAVLADAVVTVHLAFVVFVVAGGLLTRRWKRVRWVHLPAVAWAALIECLGWVCPLTPLENWLRAQAGAAGYEGAFVERYLLPVLYPVALARDAQVGLGVLVLAMNALVYWAVARRR
jgi:hypothetical protein